MGLEKGDRKTYASIVGEKPHIRVKTESTNPEAVKRDYEIPSTGEKGTKYELAYDNLKGHINAIEFVEGKFGDQLQIQIDDIILSVNLSSNFAETLMQRLPNLDLTKDVNLVPFSFEDDNKKMRKGITVYQGEDDTGSIKLPNFFFEPSKKKGEKGKNVNGLPEFPKNYEEFSKDDWKVHFIGIRKFLRKYTEDNVIPNVKNNDVPVEGETDISDIEM